MADVVPVVASVLKQTGASIENGTAGATITAGQVVYRASDNTYKLADSNLTAVEAAAVGIALHAALAGQPLQIQNAGDIALGATLSIGKLYVLSTNAGSIAPVDDIAGTEILTQIGYGKTAALLALQIVRTGVVAAAAVS